MTPVLVNFGPADVLRDSLGQLYSTPPSQTGLETGMSIRTHKWMLN